MEKGKINIFKNIKNIKDVLRVGAYFFLFLLVSLCVYTFFTVDIMKKDYANVFGYTYFTVSTGSMSGTIEVNDVIFVKITDKAIVGDVITFKNKKGEIITHRVVQKLADTYITQGDVNNVADDPVPKEDVIGKVKYVISPSFILKLIAVFLILFIFLSLINFDKIVKKYIIPGKENQESGTEVPDEIFRSDSRRREEVKSTGSTIWIPVAEIEKIEIDDEEETKDEDEIEILDDDEDFVGYQKNALESGLIDEIVNLLKIRNKLLINSRINKKWVTKFQYVYTLALCLENKDATSFKNAINNPTFEEIFDYDLEKIGFYEKLRSKIFDMPIHVCIRLMIYAVMYNDIEYFDGIYKILKYKIHLDVKDNLINTNDVNANRQVKALIKFMREFVSNYDNKNAFELDKIDKLVKIKNYE
ncbi:MAG: signal peptidase I [Bacilli bacterium]|nr:signal peptidase I [Bacilli bacterium]